MTNTKLEVINTVNEAKYYIVSISYIREVVLTDETDIMLERQSTETTFTTKESATDYFRKNCFRLQTMLKTIEIGWEDNKTFGAEVKLSACTLEDYENGPIEKEIDLMLFSAEYTEDDYV